MIEFDPAKGDARVDCTTLYKGLGQFNNVASVNVTWEWHQDDHLRSDSFGFKIPHLWRKAWVGMAAASTMINTTKATTQTEEKDCERRTSSMPALEVPQSRCEIVHGSKPTGPCVA